MTSTALFGIMARLCLILQRSPIRWQRPNKPRFILVVMDLGFRSDPSMHRAHSGPSECG